MTRMGLSRWRRWVQSENLSCWHAVVFVQIIQQILNCWQDQGDHEDDFLCVLQDVILFLYFQSPEPQRLPEDCLCACRLSEGCRMSVRRCLLQYVHFIQFFPLLEVIQDNCLIEVLCTLGVKSSGFAKSKRRVARYKATMPVLPRKFSADGQGMPTQHRSACRLSRRPMETAPLGKDSLLFRQQNLGLLSCLLSARCLSLVSIL